MGKARLYALNMGDGSGDRWTHGSKYIEIDGAKIVSMTVSKRGGKRTLVFRNHVLDRYRYNDSIEKLKDTEGLHFDGDEGDILDISKRTTNLKSGDTVINYWLKK
jgi:hypothetical protein